MPNAPFARPVAVCKEYLLTRNQALNLSASNFTQFMTKSTVYGVVVDMPMGTDLITSLACYINGAANLYFSKGGDYSGAAQRYSSVAQAARVFVTHAADYVEGLQTTTSQELPSGRVHFAYILSTKGKYRLELIPLSTNTDQSQRIFMNLYQHVMGELRNAQLKDKAAGIDMRASIVPQPKTR